MMAGVMGGVVVVTVESVKGETVDVEEEILVVTVVVTLMQKTKVAWGRLAKGMLVMCCLCDCET